MSIGTTAEPITSSMITENPREVTVESVATSTGLASTTGGQEKTSAGSSTTAAGILLKAGGLASDTRGR